MSVTRYEFELYHCNGGEMLDSDTGDYVSYDDYAALEARCAALAAENANCRNTVKVFCDVVDANTYAICEEVGQDGVKAILAAMSATGNMPTTDAFLAEVRVRARNELIDELEARFTELSKTSPTPELRSGAAGAAGFVSTFRKGVQL
ncbi:TPA: hypothetical protein JAX41_005012 [Enterobacter roggenkampii]|nr:hypothetical protein [Enterobacter roggenkampii]